MPALRGLQIATVGLVLIAPVRAQKVPDTRLDTDPPGAATSMFPQIAAAGNSLYVVWEDWRNGGNGDLYFQRSPDRGASWLTADRRIDNDAAGTAFSSGARIAASGSNVYVVWYDDRNGAKDIFFNRSLDGGASWFPSDVRLDVGDPPGASESWNPRIAASGSNVYVVWYDERNGGFAGTDILFNRSLDAGATWLPASLRVDLGDPPGAGGSNGPEIAASGSTVHIVWQDFRDGLGDVYYNRSTTAGATWPADQRLDTDFGAGVRNDLLPQIVVIGNDVHVVWYHRPIPGCLQCADIHFNRSRSGGAPGTWFAAPLRLDTDPIGSAESLFPRIAASGQFVYVTWEDDRNASKTDIYFSFSRDWGTSWQPADIRLDTATAPGSKDSSGPEVAASGTTVYVFWEDRPGSSPNFWSDIYFNRSLNSGLSWLAGERRLDTGKNPGVLPSFNPRIATSGCDFFVVWQDRRNEPSPAVFDVFFNIPYGFVPYGAGTTGSGGFTPILSGTGCATIGQVLSVDLSNAVGGATASFALAFSPGSYTASCGGTVYLNPPLFTFPVVLSGTPGVPGTGTASLGISIPVNPNLVGVNPNLQAALLDSGVSCPIVYSNALAIWIG